MKIVYIGNVGYPNTASSVHVKNRGIFMESCNHKVSVLCEMAPDGKKMPNIGDIDYQYMDPYPGKGKIRGVYWNIDQVFGRFYYKQSKKFLFKIKPDVVILYEPNSILYILSMLRLSKKEGFKLVIEATEWRNPKDYFGFITRIINIEKDLQKKYLDRKVINTIAISSYLYRHYVQQSCNTILLAPIFPDYNKKECVNQNVMNRNIIKLVYAGTLSSKDYIDTLIQVIIKINQDHIHMTFDIIGPEKKQVEKLVMTNELEKYGIKCHGRLSHDETIKIVEESDFSVLLRMDKRYAKAGVSTKFCEAMMLGVPSICTAVGGTDLFVDDGINGFLVEDNKEETLEKALLRILNLSRTQIMEIKNNAMQTANTIFTAEKYREKFEIFLDNCK